MTKWQSSISPKLAAIQAALHAPHPERCDDDDESTIAIPAEMFRESPLDLNRIASEPTPPDASEPPMDVGDFANEPMGRGLDFRFVPPWVIDACNDAIESMHQKHCDELNRQVARTISPGSESDASAKLDQVQFQKRIGVDPDGEQ